MNVAVTGRNVVRSRRAACSWVLRIALDCPDTHLHCCARIIIVHARPFSLITGAVGVLAVLSGCDAPVSTPPVSQPEQQSATPRIQTDSLKQRQADFLNRIREADPQHRTIDQAILNEQNELGLILDRSVDMDKVPDLMRTVLTQMAREFPGQDLTVIAYTPSNPPHKIGTARLNAQTRDLSYTPAL